MAPATFCKGMVRSPITGARAQFLTGLVYLNVVSIAFRVYRSPTLAWRSLRRIMELNATIRGGSQGQKFYRVGPRFFWSPVVPQWPSRPFTRFVESILDRVHPFRPPITRVGSAVLAVSSRCPLNCQHCLEADNLGTEEHLSQVQLLEILSRFKDVGVVQVVISGGEPLTRLDDVCALLRAGGEDIEFSLLTSGFDLTHEKARALRQAGLRSIQIALDHWDEEKHNRFRGHPQSFQWARQAAESANRAGLLVGFSLCAGEEFLDQANLIRYLELVKSWGGVSVRILEPRPVGRYRGKDVALSPEKSKRLGEIYCRINTQPGFSHLPRLSYPEYQKKTVGCFGAGNRLVYADSRGDLHACPFCHGSVGNVLKEDLGRLVRKLQERGCPGVAPGLELELAGLQGQIS